VEICTGKMNSIDKNPFTGNKSERVENTKKTISSPLSTLHFDDDRVVFIPSEERRAIENICFKMIQARQEFSRMAEEICQNQTSQTCNCSG